MQLSRPELDKLAEALGGLCLLACLPGSPADRAGLRYGDIVVEVNGTATPNWVAYVNAVRAGGASMQLAYYRDGARHLVQLEMPERRDHISQEELLAAVSSKVLPQQLGGRVAGHDDGGAGEGGPPN